MSAPVVRRAAATSNGRSNLEWPSTPRPSRRAFRRVHFRPPSPELSMRLAVAFAAIALPATLAAQYQQGSPLRADQKLAHDIYKELVEVNTADSVGSTTVAANAVAKRLRDAGFAESDIFQGGPRADKGNIVVRFHGNGSSGRKPLLLLAHLDVVQALKKDWSPDLDPFVFTERDGY